MKKIQIFVNGLKETPYEKNCGDCIGDMHDPLRKKCWHYGIHESISNQKTLIVCNRVKVIQQDLHITEEEDNAERYKRFSKE